MKSRLLCKIKCIVTLKDHPKFKLINPAKSEFGKVSKIFREDINTKVREM